MFKREIKLPKDKNIFLFGPRQTGKTSLIRSLFPKAMHIDLLKTSEYYLFLQNPEFLRERVSENKSKIIFIDEIQRVPELLNEVHRLIEEDKTLKFILTGSSARKLKRGSANLLAGRAFSYHLYPLTSRELNFQFSIKEMLSFGSLPPIFSFDDRESKNDFLRTYTETYVKEEVVAESLTRNLPGFLRFLQVAGQCNGEQLNFSNIGKDVQLNHVTVKDYFSILSDTLLGFFLLPFEYSERKRHKVAPKFYFFDPGVVRALQEVLAAPLRPKTFSYGNLFETWIINEVKRYSDYFKKDFRLSFLRTANDVEVDLIIQTPHKKIIAVEIKSSERPLLKDFKSGFLALESLCKIHKKIVVTPASFDRKVEDVAVLGFKSFMKFLEEI